MNSPLINSFLNLNIDFSKPVGLVFDVDELLFDNSEDIFLAYKTILDHRKIAVDPLETFPGKDLFQICKNIKEKYNLDADVDVLVQERRQIYINRLKMTPSVCHKGVPQTLNFVDRYRDDLELRLAYASSSEQTFIDIILKKVMKECGLVRYEANPDQFFYSVNGIKASTSWREGLKKKPDPGLHKLTIEKLGLNSGQCILFEDSKSGFEAGIQTGANIVVIPTVLSQDFFKNLPAGSFSREKVCKLNSMDEFLPVLEACRNFKKDMARIK